MYLIHAVPISRAAGVESLTYFSARDFCVGSVVEAPVRNKKTRAIVYASEPLSDAKARVKKSDFALKKISATEPIGTIAPEVLRAAEYTARFFAVPLGAALFTLLAEELLTRHSIEEEPSKQSEERKMLLLEMPRIARERAYSALAREEPLVIIAPTLAELEQLAHMFEKENIQTVFLTSALSKKMFRAEMTKLDTAQVLLATPAFAPFARRDMRTIIFEREGSELYRARARGKIDSRVFLKKLAKERGMRIVCGDMPVRTEIMDKESVLRSVTVGDKTPRLVNQKHPKKIIENPQEKKMPFRAISPELESAVRAAFLQKGRALIWSARRGLAPMTVCNDCGASVACPNCGAPIVLHGTTEKRVYLCHSCGTAHRTNILCRVCGSWNLAGLGIGTERIAEEAHTLFPDAHILRMDSDSTKTHAAAKKTCAAFYETPRALLIATDLALPYLSEPIGTVGIASFDTLLSLPAWNAFERALGTICALAELSQTPLIIQTRQKDNELFSILSASSLASFHQKESKARQAFSYPPETTLIKLSIRTKNPNEAAREIARMHSALGEAKEITTLPATKRGVYTEHTLIARIPSIEWPKENILAHLYALAPTVEIVINPTRILS